MLSTKIRIFLGIVSMVALTYVGLEYSGVINTVKSLEYVQTHMKWTDGRDKLDFSEAPQRYYVTSRRNKQKSNIVHYGNSSDGDMVYSFHRYEQTSEPNRTRRCLVHQHYSVTTAIRAKLQHRYVDIMPNHLWDPNGFLESDIQPSFPIKPALIPNVVHLIWCGGFFKFPAYLSILSVFKTLKPTRILFYYKTLPVVDDRGYYNHYSDIIRDVPGFEPTKLSDADALAVCSGNSAEKSSFISRLLTPRGGIFIDNHVMLAKRLLISNGNGNELDARACEDASSYDVITAATNQKKLFCYQCPLGLQFVSGRHVCARIGDKLVQPNVIEDSDSDFNNVAMWVLRGKTKSQKSDVKSSKVPLYVHYVNYRQRGFPFYYYLSILSSIYVLGAETVYVHGNPEPEGENWNKAKATGKVKFIWRDNIDIYFGHRVYHVSHPSDLLRLDVLSRYGGLYLDWDAMWVKPLTEEMRMRDFSASVDWTQDKLGNPFFNFGVEFGKADAEIFQYFIEEYRHYIVQNRPYNPVEILANVYENHPDKMTVDPHVQVICHFSNCHPTWIPGYWMKNNTHRDVLKFDWRTEAYAIHWTYPDPGEFASEKALRNSKGMFADIGQFVMKKAKLL